MTITNTTARVDYAGAGSAGPYSFTFKVFLASDLLVTYRDTDDVETVLTYPSDFSVTGIGDGSGGTLTLDFDLESGETLTIERNPALTQPVQLRNQGSFFPANYENALDRGVMIAQRLNQLAEGSVRLPDSIDPADFDPTLPTVLAANTAIVVNSAGTGFSTAALTDAQLTALQATQSMEHDAFVDGVNYTAGSSTTVTLSADPGSEDNLRVLFRTSGTVRELMTDEYSVSGVTLTFGATIPAGTTRIEVWYLLTFEVNRVLAQNSPYSRSETGAVIRDVRTKLREVLSVTDFGAVGDGATDDTVAIQAALDAAAIAGGTTIVPPGTYNHTTITVGAGCALVLDTGAVLNHTVWNENGIVLETNAILRGGTILSPETWDGTNTEWLYAVVFAEGDGVSVENVTLTNVPRVGIGFKQVNVGRVLGCTIVGNYPAGQWTGVETVHFGVGIDPFTAPTNGGFIVSATSIDSCVQGVFAGNYGAGSAQGTTIAGNVFSKCWNHGVYVSAGCSGFAIGGNAFDRCALPIAATGIGHSITANTLLSADTGDGRDEVSISVRDPVRCVVVGNTLIGDGQTLGVAIDVSENLGVECYGNIVSNNVVVLAGGTSAAIRIGAGGATTFRDNIISGNIVRSVGQPSGSALGVVLMNAAAGDGEGCRVSDNVIVVLGDANGLVAKNLHLPILQGNHIRLEYDAPSAKTLGGVRLDACVGAQVLGNTFLVTADWGTNVAFRAIWEIAGSSASVIGDNTFSLDPTKLTSGTALVLLGTGAKWQTSSVSSDRGDTSPTLVFGVDAPTQRFATVLSANRTVTLSATNAINGARFRVVRTGLGTFTLDVGGLKTIAVDTAAFVDVEHDGTAWRLAAYGAL